MNITNLNELKPGEYYFHTWRETNHSYIFKLPDSYTPNSSFFNLYYLKAVPDKFYGYISSIEWTNRCTIRKATDKEIRHIKACEKAKKYVDCPKDEIINDYQII